MNKLVKISDKSNNSVYDRLSNPVIYNIKDYGLPEGFTGKDVKVAIVDTGKPDHKEIINIAESINVFDDSKEPNTTTDRHGHSTMISGFISGNGLNIKGLAPDCMLYYAKVSDENGYTNYNAVVAGILWAIVKEVDVILLPFNTGYDFELLHSSIKKANDANICVLAATANNKEKQYPADYKEVFSFKAETSSDNQKIIKQQTLPSNLIIHFPVDGLETTYLNNSFIKANGSSFAAAIGTGLCASIISKRKSKNLVINSKVVFAELANLNL